MALDSAQELTVFVFCRLVDKNVNFRKGSTASFLKMINPLTLNALTLSKALTHWLYTNSVTFVKPHQQ